MRRTGLPAQPLIPADDYPLHQTAQPFVRVAGTHPKWTERWYFNLQDDDGAMLGIVGGGFYPQAGVLEVYACLLLDGHQSNLRQRVRHYDRTRLDGATAVTFQVEEAMTTWTAQAQSAEFTLDLRFDARQIPYLFPPFFVAADLPHEAPGLEFDTIQHFVQPGSIRGTVSHGDRSTQFRGVSFRDRTWGVRTARPRLHQWYVLHLDDGGYLTLIHQERADGSPLVSHVALVDATGAIRRGVLDAHQLHFDPRSRLLREARYDGHDGSGNRIAVRVENIGEGVRLLGAGYTAAQGDDDGLGAVAAERWDLTDPDVSARLGRGTIDSPVRATVTWGDRETSGTGVTETAIARNHWRYGTGLV